MIEPRRPLSRPAVVLLLLAACSAQRAPGPGPKVATTRVPVAPPHSAAAPLVSPPGMRLPDTFRPAAQRVTLEITPSAEHFSGRTEIEGTLSTATDLVWLNADAMEIDGASARVGTEEVKADPVVGNDQRVALRFHRSLPAGPVTLLLGFRGTLFTHEDSGIFRQQSGGEWYAFTQFEETDARRAFPCADDPSVKIPWTLTLRIPSGLKAVANAPEESSTPSGEAMTLVRFRPTRPLPSYLVAFGVGPFDFLDGRPAGKRKVPVRIVAPRGRAAEGAYAARVAPEILEVLEGYFGIAYPYEKLDILTIPFTVQFGAMENAGLVTFRESSVLARPEEDGVRRRRRFAVVAAHEFAHQWFGDLVTLAWWNDTWLNEAFATWMEHKAIERWAPSWGTAAERVDERNRAATADGLLTARRIRQPIESYNDIRNAFDAITYQKGASVIRMFELYVGEAAFQRGIHQYLEAHADGNATAADFLRSISEAAGRDVTPAFSTFLDQPGVPRVRASLRCGSGPRPVLHLEQDRWLASGARAGTWQLPVCVRWATRGRKRTQCMLLDRAEADLELDSRACPDWVLPNAGYGGYFRLQLEGTLRDRLIRSRALDDAEVVGLLGDTEALGKGGALPRAVGLALAARYARAREHHVSDTAIRLATVEQEYLPGRLAGDYKAWVRRTFGFRALELGFSERPGEDDEAKLIRPELVTFVARRGEEPKLIAEARSIADRWLARCEGTSRCEGRAGLGGIDSETLWGVMEVAGKSGNAGFRDRLAGRLDNTTDLKERGWLLDGLSATRDSALLEANLVLAASGKLNPAELTRLLTGQRYRREDPPADWGPARMQLMAGVGARWEVLTELMPRGGVAALYKLVRASCSAEERARAEEVFRPHVETVLGGPRQLAQAEESLDICIAQKQRDVPSLQQFFAPFQPAPRR